MTDIQSGLYAFIFSLIGDGDGAGDVLQETNLVLWQKEANYDPSRKFAPWAFKIAYLQVLAYRKRQRGDRLVFDDELVGTLAAEFQGELARAGERLGALNDCVQRLPDRQQHMVIRRYTDGMSIDAIAQQYGVKDGTVKATLFRIRRALAKCVERSLNWEVAR